MLEVNRPWKPALIAHTRAVLIARTRAVGDALSPVGIKRVWKPVAIVLLLASGAAAISLTSMTSRQKDAGELAKGAAPKQKADPNVLRFAPGAPQLTAIRVAPVEEHPVPLAEPLNGRVAYDENATARVSSPILGRVVSLKVLPGDTVKAGDPVFVMDSPDLAQAVADVAKARADVARKKRAFERAQSLVEAGGGPRKAFGAAE